MPSADQHMRLRPPADVRVGHPEDAGIGRPPHSTGRKRRHQRAIGLYVNDERLAAWPKSVRQCERRCAASDSPYGGDGPVLYPSRHQLGRNAVLAYRPPLENDRPAGVERLPGPLARHERRDIGQCAGLGRVTICHRSVRRRTLQQECPALLSHRVLHWLSDRRENRVRSRRERQGTVPLAERDRSLRGLDEGQGVEVDVHGLGVGDVRENQALESDRRFQVARHRGVGEKPVHPLDRVHLDIGSLAVTVQQTQRQSRLVGRALVVAVDPQLDGVKGNLDLDGLGRNDLQGAASRRRLGVEPAADADKRRSLGKKLSPLVGHPEAVFAPDALLGADGSASLRAPQQVHRPAVKVREHDRRREVRLSVPQLVGPVRDGGLVGVGSCDGQFGPLPGGGPEGLGQADVVPVDRLPRTVVVDQ